MDEDGELTIWSLDDFEVYEAPEDGLPDYKGGVVTHKSLRTFTDYIQSDEELDIQTAGFTKCRLQVLAKRYIIREGEVLYADLRAPEPIDEWRRTVPIEAISRSRVDFLRVEASVW